MLPDQKYIVGDSLPELGYKCSVDGVITWITNLEKGLIEGENELEWRFTPDNTDNYETVTGTALIVAETTTTTTSSFQIHLSEAKTLSNVYRLFLQVKQV